MKKTLVRLICDLQQYLLNDSKNKTAADLEDMSLPELRKYYELLYEIFSIDYQN